MKIKEILIKLEKKGIITRKPKPIFIYVLFLAYLLIWIVVFALYLKLDMFYLKIWIIILGILNIITLIHAILHNIITKILENS